jgi:HEAT repeat protein
VRITDRRADIVDRVMATKGKKKITFEEELALLSPAAAQPTSADGRARILAALASSRSLVVARAARIVKEHTLDGFVEALSAAFDRLLPSAADSANPPVHASKSDPGCHAKLGLIEALDQLETVNGAPFARAVRHVQQEGSSDMAAPLRARAIGGLARLGHPDFQLFVARLLNDPWPPVRQAALESLAHRGDGAGAALALFKVELGDEDPLVTMAAMTALVTLAPEWALDVLGALLDRRDGDGGRRELAAVALGQSRREDALALLLDRLRQSVRAADREPLLRAIGLHRSERALAAMLAVVGDGQTAEATLAVEALAARRFEPGVAERVRAAVATRDEADLEAAGRRADSLPPSSTRRFADRRPVRHADSLIAAVLAAIR